MTDRVGRRRVGGLRRQTLRTRVTVLASLALTVAVVLGVLVMYLLQMNSVRRTIDGQLRTYAAQIAETGQSGSWPRPLAPSVLDQNAEAQVLDRDGTVLAATRSLAGLPAVYAVPAGSTTPVRQKAADNVIPSEVRVVAVTTTVHGRQVTIVAGTPTTLLREINTEFARHLLIGLPVILLLAGATVWLIVGRALRPVEQIRRTVEEITSADLAQRVPEPGTADEVGHLAETMNGMLSRLESAAHRQRRFVADASHELRSPLATIRTTLEVGLAHADLAPWPEIADRAVQQAARMQELIRQLLLLAKADERQLAARQQHIDLRALLDTLCASTASGVVGITLDTDAREHATGDPEHLERLFRNLLDNAVRYAHSQAVITVSAQGQSIRVTVDDDGPGIPAADRQRVFDRFVRLDPSRERGSGTTGLGLAIAREIATAHGGHISISDSPLGGARISVELPRAPDVPEGTP